MISYKNARPWVSPIHTVLFYLLAFSLVCAPFCAAGAEQSSDALDPARPMVALTFDDGPCRYTAAILDLFVQYGGHGTFCMVGERLDKYSDIVKRVSAEGHQIATHTWAHMELPTLSSSEVETQLRLSIDAIEAMTGQTVRMLRPPFGSLSDRVDTIAWDMGLYIVKWSIDPADWQTNDANATYYRTMNQIADGSIVLYHDLESSTRHAMERVIPELIEQGYQLVTVDELLGRLEGGPQAGTVYRSLHVD